MGVTIHFEGRLRDQTAYEGFLGVVSSLARSQGWQTETIKSAEVTLLRVRDEQEWDYVGPVKGIAVYLHEDCDPVRLEFDRDLYVQEFTKTQFAGAEYHLKVINLLKTIQPFFSELKVDDEAEYWDTNDRATLQYHLDTVQKLIEAELKKNPLARARVKAPDGKIIDLMN
jgi:hypothetical protein